MRPPVEPPAWWQFARLLTSDLDFGVMHERAITEFAGIKRSEAILGAVVAAQVGRADAIIAAIEIAGALQDTGRAAA